MSETSSPGLPYQEDSYNRALGMLRRAALAALVVALLLLARPTPTRVFIGSLVVALGEAIRFWAAGYLFKTRELVTSGPYAYTRNPLYLGRLLIFTGLCLMAPLPFAAHWWILALGLLYFFAFYLRRKERVEPSRLRRFHGEDYERYRAAVPALFPSLRPYDRPSATRWSAERLLGNRELWMVAGLTLATLFLLARALHRS